MLQALENQLIAVASAAGAGALRHRGGLGGWVSSCCWRTRVGASRGLAREDRLGCSSALRYLSLSMFNSCHNATPLTFMDSGFTLKNPGYNPEGVCKGREQAVHCPRALC